MPAGIFEQDMRARNRVGIGLSYRPARLHRLAEAIPGLLKNLKIPAQIPPFGTDHYGPKQGFGSGYGSSIFSNCGSGFRIRILDPDPGFDDLKLKKIYN